MKSHNEVRVRFVIWLAILALIDTKVTIGQNEADRIRMDDPCAVELRLSQGTRSDNLACPTIVPNGRTGTKCFNITEICDGETEFCANSNDEGRGFTSPPRIVCGTSNTNNTFACSSTESVLLEKICDGNKDCSGGEDERFILCKNKCSGSYYGGCPITRRCENSNDSVVCGDCFPGYVTDPNSPTGDCLPVIKVAFESPSYTATESRPVEVCVNATDPRIKSQQRLNVTVVIAPATMGDYLVPSEALRKFTLTKRQPRGCVNISIVDDNLVEDDETFTVSLTTSSGDQVLIGEPNTITIRILDNDVMMIGFTETCYTTPNQVNTEVCLEIKNKVTLQRIGGYRVLLARNQRCSHIEEPRFIFRNNDTTGSRACLMVAVLPDERVTGPCQNINLLQSCQVQIEGRRQIATFQEPTVAKVCFSTFTGFCRAENVTANKTTFIWLNTPAGTNATFRCPDNPSHSVTRRCMACMRAAIWQDFDQQGCGVLSGQLEEIVNSSRAPSLGEVSATVRRLAEVIADSVNRPIDQTRENLKTTAFALNSIASFARMQPVADNTIVMSSTETVDRLLQWTPTAIEANTSSSLIQSFEAISSAYAEQLPINSTQSFTFQSLSLIAQRVDLEDVQEGRSISIDRENFTIENGVILNSSSKDTPSQTSIPTISLPPAVFRQLNNVTSTGLVFTLYDQSTLFLVGNISEASRNTNTTMTVVGSQVIAANVAQDEPKFENLDDPVLVLLPVRISGEGFLMSGSEVCVSWDFNLSDWTSRGCRTSVGRNGTILCTCDHLTNFAVIVDICSRQEDCQPIDPTVDTILSFVSYIGIVISIIGLILTIITMLAFKKIREKDATIYHVQLCLSLLLMLTMALVLVAVGSAGVVNILYGGCIFISITVHYFTLVAVMWMAAEALLMFQKVVIVFVRITVTQIAIVSLICWMVPIIPVLATLIADQALGQDPVHDIIISRPEEGYICFLSHAGAFWGAFLGPILLIMAFNMVVFVCVIVILTRHVRSTATQQKFKAKKFIRLMFSIGGVMALFGLTWLFATLTISVSGLRETFQILFTIFNSFQGFFIFLFFCVLNKEARDSWKEIFFRISGRKKLDSSQTSLPEKHTSAYATDLSSSHVSSASKTEPKPSSASKTEIKPLSLLPVTSNNRDTSDTDSAALPLSPSASKPGKVLGLDDVPETSTFHITPSKTTFIT